MRLCRLVVVAALATIAVACGDDAPDDGPEAMVQPTDEADVLAAVAAHVIFIENSLGGEATFEQVNVVESYGVLNQYDMLIPDAADQLPGGVRNAVAAILAPLPVSWVPSLDHVIDLPEYPDHRQVGAVLTLSRPRGEDDWAEVTTNLWCGGTCGAGATYVVERSADGAWTITGTTGSSWVS